MTEYFTGALAACAIIGVVIRLNRHAKDVWLRKRVDDKMREGNKRIEDLEVKVRCLEARQEKITGVLDATGHRIR